MLIFEAIVVILAIPVAISVYAYEPAVVLPVGLGLTVLCVVVSGLQGRRGGLAAGWVAQGLVLLTGFVVPTMFFLGAVFTALWYAAIWTGRRAETIQAAHAREAATAADSAPGQ